MTHRSGCLVCGAALVYRAEPSALSCALCGQPFETTAACANGHYVCDACHSLSADDWIEKYCLQTQETDPGQMAMALMRSPRIAMHGPEHHFLVPAVLLAASHNLKGSPAGKKGIALRRARHRAENVLGNFCGLYGACGAAVGTGIFVSVWTGATPLSKDEWRWSNQVTACSLAQIAERGGPRCCKRDTFTALETACQFAADHLGVRLPLEQPICCELSALNRECLLDACGYYALG